MFKECMKRYFISLRHIFGVLGILFMALLIGGSIFIGCSHEVLNNMTEELKTTTGQADLSVTRIGDAMKNSIIDMYHEGEISTDDNKVVSGEEAEAAIHQSVDDALNETVDNYSSYISEVSGIVGEAVSSILSLLAVYVLIQVISWTFGRGYVLTAERADLHRRGEHIFKDKILHSIFVHIVFFAAGGCLLINDELGPVLLVCLPIFCCIASLVGSNLAFDKDKRLPMKKALRIRNIFCLLGTNILQIAFTLLVVVGVAYISNLIIALYVDIALIIIVTAVVKLNSDSIIVSLIEKEAEEN